MFVIQIEMPNGSNCNWHKVQKFEVHADGTHAVVNSYPRDTLDMIGWQDTYTIPAPIVINSLADVEEVLTTNITSPFQGASVVPDEVETLETAKARKWAEVKSFRVTKMQLPCTTPSGVVDADSASVTNIQGAAQGAALAKMAASPLSMDWRMHDNTLVTMDADAVIAMALAVMAQVQGCYARSWALETEIEAADTIEAVQAVDITVGWPG
jgi:hypothetical protein